MSTVAAAFAAFWGMGTLFSWLYLPALLLGRSGDRLERRHRAQAIVRGGWVRFLDGLRAVRLYDVDARRYRDTVPCPAVLVANHPSIIDVTLILSVFERTSCVVKGGIFRGPLVGRLVRLAGHIDGGDGSLTENQRVFEEALARLAEGDRVLVFPEGTRSPSGGLRPFRRGPFELAARAGVPLVPLFITCDPPALNKEHGVTRFPDEVVRYGVTVLPARRVGTGRAEVREAMEQVRALFEARIRASSSAQSSGTGVGRVPEVAA